MTPMTLGRTEQPIQEIVGIYTNNEEDLKLVKDYFMQYQAKRPENY